jgi:hypothetical protein
VIKGKIKVDMVRITFIMKFRVIDGFFADINSSPNANAVI